ncbi:MAG: aminotransferase class V-fold PLP-dependent enzyme [Clostridiales bacterium]|nr:aminotransferase class V-fold PLP-dependent enzyme [Clostridiales bacterium]
MIYLDNAATTGKKPQSVINAVDSSLREYCANPGRSGHAVSMKTAAAVYNTRQELADFFGATGAENVVFTMNCTHSINCVIKGLLKAGDRVVTSSLEHNAVMRPLYKVGAAVDVAAVSLTDDNITLNNFERLIRPDTKLVICTGASNVLGKALPIGQIGALCRIRGVPFAVDAAQTAGVFPINMQKQDIDYLCIAPHKGLYAPMGIGVLICEKPLKNTILVGGTGTNSAELVQPDFLPERLESCTVNVPGIMGTAAGLKYVKKLGTEKIYSHEMALCGLLYTELEKIPKVELYSPKPFPGGWAPLISFNVKGYKSGETARYLNEHGIAVRAGLQCAPTAHRVMGTIENGAVRAAPATFNTAADIKALISAIKKA